MGKIVNQSELAEFLGKSDVTIWEWQKEGLPILKQGDRGEANQYDSEAVIAWWLAREVKKVSGATQKDRLARLQGDLLELELAEKNNVLVPVAEIEPTWQTRVLTAAAFMASRHSRLAGELEAIQGIEAKRQMLKKSDAEFLDKLGVDGERMQAVVEELLAKISSDEAAAFLRRIAGHDDQQHPAGPSEEGLGAAGPA